MRCARENQDDPQTSCKHCIALGIPCTYDYQPKKRGPPNLSARPRPASAELTICRYLRRLQEAAAAAAQQQQDASGGPKPAHDAVSTPPMTIPSQASPAQPASMGSHTSTSPFLESPINTMNSLPTAVTIPPSRYPIAADTFHSHFAGMHNMPPFDRRTSEASSSTSVVTPRPSTGTSVDAQLRSPTETFSTYPLYNWASSYKQHQSLPVPPPNSLPPLSYYYRPHRLEDVAPRDTIMLIVSLFFDFVFPLTPCVHKPSFMADLHSRREERDPIFFALVMSTCASTLVQVPRSFLPMERPAVRKLAQICFEASRHISVASYDPPTSMHVVIRYLSAPSPSPRPLSH